MSTIRRSQRLKRPVNANANDSDFGARELYNENLERPKAKTVKRRKVTAGDKDVSEVKHVVQRGKGKLRNLPHMPIDILFEIFSFLTPLELLRLARTTQNFRLLLMKRSSISLWKTVFENVPDAPEKPEDMSEPAWANFLFTNNCSECLSPRASYTFSAHCVRYCKRCVKDKVYLSPYSDPTIALELSQFSSPPGYFRITHSYRMSLKTRRYRSATVWLKSAFQKFIDDYKLVHDDEQERSKFLDMHSERLKIMGTREDECNAWFAKKHSQRTDELGSVRDARFEYIKRKLTELGWAFELEKMDYTQLQEMKRHPAVRVSKPLTDRTRDEPAWPKVEGELVSFMEKTRIDRLKRERAEIVKERRRVFALAVKNYAETQPADAILPTAADLYSLESFAPFKQLIEESPVDQEISPSTFDEFLAAMPTHCEQWKAACVNALSRTLRFFIPKGMSTTDFLSLAKTAFKCQRCSTVLSSPHIFTHPCFRKPPPVFYDGYELSPLTSALQCARWLDSAPQCLRLMSPWQISEIILACGLDPATATHEELDAANLWLVASIPGASHVMRWQRALMTVDLEDDRDDSWYQGPVDEPPRYSWTRVTDESLMQEYNIEELNFYKQRTFGAPFVCAHCSKEVAANQFVPHMATHKPEHELKQSDFRLPPARRFPDFYCRTLHGNPPFDPEDWSIMNWDDY